MLSSVAIIVAFTLLFQFLRRQLRSLTSVREEARDVLIWSLCSLELGCIAQEQGVLMEVVILLTGRVSTKFRVISTGGGAGGLGGVPGAGGDLAGGGLARGRPLAQLPRQHRDPVPRQPRPGARHARRQSDQLQVTNHNKVSFN